MKFHEPPQEWKELWERAQNTGDKVSLGDIVLCDCCTDDFTNRKDSGGFVFSGYAYCPNCAKESLQKIKEYGEEKHIKAKCPKGVSFADFVRDFRGPNNFIHVQSF